MYIGASCNQRQRGIHTQTAEAHNWWNLRVRTQRLLVCEPLESPWIQKCPQVLDFVRSGPVLAMFLEFHEDPC